MKNKEIRQSKVKEELIPVKEEKKEGKKKVGRPTILTPELKSKLIKLFEEHFLLQFLQQPHNFLNNTFLSG